MGERVELPQVERCEGCRYWKCKVKVPFARPWPEKSEKWETAAEYEDVTDEAAGECRRYPRVLDKWTDDWCGEWQAKPAPAPDTPA